MNILYLMFENIKIVEKRIFITFMIVMAKCTNVLMIKYRNYNLPIAYLG
jgi:hypothetical protein